MSSDKLYEQYVHFGEDPLRVYRGAQFTARLGFDLDHHLSTSSLISLSGHVASAGQDPDYSGALSYKMLF